MIFKTRRRSLICDEHDFCFAVSLNISNFVFIWRQVSGLKFTRLMRNAATLAEALSVIDVIISYSFGESSSVNSKILSSSLDGSMKQSNAIDGALEVCWEGPLKYDTNMFVMLISRIWFLILSSIVCLLETWLWLVSEGFDQNVTCNITHD